MSNYQVKLYGVKAGMTEVVQGGFFYPSTVVYIPKHVIVSVKTKESHGYNALVVGVNTEIKKVKNINKPQAKEFEKLGQKEINKIFEIRLSDDQDIEGINNLVGKKFDSLDFLDGLQLNVKGRTKGKGFAGAMKRHNFGGMRASHGVSISHRAHGSTGQCQDPGKVFKGKKMAGHMGDKIRTVKNLLVNKINKEASAISFEGAVPGSVGSLVEISSTVTYKNLKSVSQINGVQIKETKETA